MTGVQTCALPILITFVTVAHNTQYLVIEEIQLAKCKCHLIAVQLLKRGLFPCAPIAPTLAVDIRILDFLQRLFVRISPNHTAIAQALEDCLAAQGYKLETKVCLVSDLI